MMPTEEELLSRVAELERRLKAHTSAKDLDPFDLFPIGFVLVGLDSRFLRCNEAFCRFLGRDEASLLGMTFIDVTHDEDRATSRAHVDALLRGGLDGGGLEKRYIHASGRDVWGAVSIRVLRDDAGAPLCFFSAVQDITERKRAGEALRDSEERLRAILEHSPMSMAIVGMDQTIEYFNKKALITFGYTPEDIPHMDDWWRLAYPDPAYRAEVIAGWTDLTLRAIAEHREIEPREYRVTCKDGAVKTTLISGVPVAGKVFVLFDDITERKNREESLREADARKSQFLSVLSHELRNPMTPIRYSVHLLERQAGLDETGRRAVQTLDRQTTHLVALIDDLLDVTRIAQGKVRLHRQRLDLVGLLRRVVDDHRSLVDGRQLDLWLPSGAVWVEGDGTRLTQVVGNLLSNAAKFTPRGGGISVSLQVRAGEALITVDDTGVGIDPAMLARLFEPFAQADSSLDRSPGGLGLGLALVKGFVEQHGGRVEAHSEGVGRGSRLVIALPADPEASDAAAEPNPAPPMSIGRRVLIIEDNRDSAVLLRDILRARGHAVTVAFTGTEGLARARDSDPDIVFCDIGLPEMDGYAVAQAIRAEPRLASVRLVALTGYGQPEDRQRGQRAGFDKHIVKPPDLDELERLVAETSPRAAREESNP